MAVDSSFVSMWNGNAVIIWLLIFAIFLVIELITLGLTTIWFSGGALAGMVVALCGGSPLVQVIVAIVVSVVLLLALRPFAVKFINKDRTATNIQEIIGQTAKVTEQISNNDHKGQVLLRGIEWTARSSSGEVIEVGELVKIQEISGVKVIVEKVTEN